MAQILSGREVSKEIQLKLAAEVKKMSIVPKLAIVQVGAREDSNVYIRMKRKFAEDVGVETEHYALPRTTTEADVGQMPSLSTQLIMAVLLF